jgi:hypothetical protein
VKNKFKDWLYSTTFLGALVLSGCDLQIQPRDRSPSLLEDVAEEINGTPRPIPNLRESLDFSPDLFSENPPVNEDGLIFLGTFHTVPFPIPCKKPGYPNPREGVYEVKWKGGKTKESSEIAMFVDDTLIFPETTSTDNTYYAVYSSAYRLINSSYCLMDSDNDDCKRNCHCPSNGNDSFIRFDTETKFTGRFEHLIYCDRISKITFTGTWMEDFVDEN